MRYYDYLSSYANFLLKNSIKDKISPKTEEKGQDFRNQEIMKKIILFMGIQFDEYGDSGNFIVDSVIESIGLTEEDKDLVSEILDGLVSRDILISELVNVDGISQKSYYMEEGKSYDLYSKEFDSSEDIWDYIEKPIELPEEEPEPKAESKIIEIRVREKGLTIAQKKIIAQTIFSTKGKKEGEKKQTITGESIKNIASQLPTASKYKYMDAKHKESIKSFINENEETIKKILENEEDLEEWLSMRGSRAQEAGNIDEIRRALWRNYYKTPESKEIKRKQNEKEISYLEKDIKELEDELKEMLKDPEDWEKDIKDVREELEEKRKELIKLK